MSIILNDNEEIRAPKPIDSRYFRSSDGLQPRPDITTALADPSLATPLRYQGLTINIAGVEYRWKDGITDPELVIKTMGGTGGGGKKYVFFIS